MASNDQPFSNLPSRFRNCPLRSSRRNVNGRDDAKKSHVAPAKAPNRDSGDETVNDRRRKIEVFDIKNVDNLADCVVRSVRIAMANNEAMIAKEQNVFKIERAGEKLPTLSGQCSGVNAVTSSNGSSCSHDRMVRDKNKNLRRIYQEEGLNYGKDVTAAELKSRISTAVELRQNSIAKVFKVLNASRDVQLCFLVDVTESMEKYIDGVRDSIFKIVEKLSEKHVTVVGHSTIAKKVSLAFVGYRNYGLKNPFELLPFTESAENFRQFCSKIDAYGAPEDVFGGLEKAIFDLNCADISMCTKIIFHITDHPCRGRKYHSSNYPRYPFPDGDPNGRIAETLFEALREKGIQYHFGKITSRTDKMIEVFSEAMGSDIEVFDIKDLDNLVDCVVSSISIAISNNPRAMIANQHVIKIERTVSKFSMLPTFSSVLYSYEMPESMDNVIRGVPVERKHPSKANVQIAENPFAHGSERQAFYGRVLSGNTSVDIVLKEYIRNNTDTASRSVTVPYEIATQMQTIASIWLTLSLIAFKRCPELYTISSFWKLSPSRLEPAPISSLWPSNNKIKIVLEEIESVGIFKDFLLAVSPLRIQRMSDSADFKNDYTDFVIVAENEWSRRKEERWNVYIDNTLWEIHEDLTEGRNAATISRVVCQLLLPERKRCDAEVLFISNNAVWNKVRVKFLTDDENVSNVIYGSHKLVRKNSASYLMLGKSNQKVVIRILEDKQKILKEFANRSAADVTFVVNGEECKGDREYLAGLSPVFKAMLYGQFAEAQQDKIVLEEIESVGIFKDFLLAVSPLRIQPNPSNVVALLELAQRFDIPFLTRNCEDHLLLCYEISLADRILLAVQYGLRSLKTCTMLQSSNDDLQQILRENSDQWCESERRFLRYIIAYKMEEMRKKEQMQIETKMRQFFVRDGFLDKNIM